jgi:hypothetical protein
MAATNAYITAGLPYPKDSGQTPGAGETVAFITAGVPKVVEAAAGGNAPTGHLYGPLVGSLGGPI